MLIEDSFVARTVDAGAADCLLGLVSASTPEPAAVERPRLQRIAVRSLNRIVIVRVETIVRLDAEDNYVRIWADRLYLHKETLTRLVSRLDPERFSRVHRSHAINLDCVR